MQKARTKFLAFVQLFFIKKYFCSSYSSITYVRTLFFGEKYQKYEVFLPKVIFSGLLCAGERRPVFRDPPRAGLSPQGADGGEAAGVRRAQRRRREEEEDAPADQGTHRRHEGAREFLLFLSLKPPFLFMAVRCVRF